MYTIYHGCISYVSVTVIKHCDPQQLMEESIYFGLQLWSMIESIVEGKHGKGSRKLRDYNISGKP